MTTWTLIAALACPQAQPLAAGDPAPCSGILWGVEQSRAALACRKVELPTCRADAERAEEVSAARLEGCEKRVELAQGLAEALAAEEPPEPDGAPWWAVATVGGGALVLGFVVGFVVAVER